MRKLIALLFLVQGVLMSSVLDFVEVKGAKIPLIFEEDHHLPIAAMQIVFQKSGSIEDKNLSGLAKFSSKMLNEGTKSLGSVAFAKKLEERAIHFSASSGSETLVLELGSLKEELALGTKLLSELLKDPNLTPESFEKVKTMTLGTLLRKENDYDYIASVNLDRLLFEGTPLASPADGTKEDIERLTLDDVRRFLKEHLVLSKIIAVVGGDMDIKEAKEFVRIAIGSLEVGSEEPLGFYDASKEQKTISVNKDTQQAYIYFGAPFYMKPTDPESYKAKVAAFILGSGGFGSRIMEEIRVKRGLAYSAYCRININKSNSSFSGYLQTKLESQQEAAKLVKELIGEFLKNGATQKELEGAKKFLLGSEPLRNETLSQRLSRSFMEYYKGLPLGYSKEELKKIESLTLEELNAFIKNHQEMSNLSFSIVTK